jgi:hypothetical protein
VNERRRAKILAQMRENRAGVDYADLADVCDEYFGEPRQTGSHLVYKTPWPGDPRVNIQRGKGRKAKPYQVKQVLAAIDKLEEQRGESK